MCLKPYNPRHAEGVAGDQPRHLRISVKEKFSIYSPMSLSEAAFFMVPKSGLFFVSRD